VQVDGHMFEPMCLQTREMVFWSEAADLVLISSETVHTKQVRRCR
jgi:hypothetical protein